MKNIVVIASLAIISPASLAKTIAYGELHASADTLFDVGSGANDGLDLNDSFLGFKGSHEIKKDVSLIYNMAWSFKDSGFEDQDGDGIQNRNQAIGLASPSGALIVGRFDTPFKKVGEKADLFWHSQIGQNRNLTNAATWDVRADKIIVLQSPKKKGMQFSLAYASDISDTSGVTDNASAVSLNGFYRKGKFSLGAAYEKHNLDLLSGSREAVRLSASYKQGPFKYVGFLQKEDNNLEQTSEPDALVLGLGASFKKGKGTIKGQWYQRDTDSDAKNSNLFAVGYDYKVSKKLDVYAQAAKITHAFSLGRNEAESGSTSLEDNINGLSLGMRFRF